MENEIWRKADCPGTYEISSYGNIRNKKTGKQLSPIRTSKGYLAVNIYIERNRRKQFLVHRIVAKAFPEICGEWFEGCQINHKDECKSNNSANNIEVCNAAYNLSYNNGQARRGKKARIPVAQYDNDGNLIDIWDSATEVENVLKINHSAVAACCRGKRNVAGGYKWGYQ